MFDGALVRAQRRPQPRRAVAGLPPDGRAHGLGAGREAAGAASRARARSIEEGDEADYAACVLGLRDYVDKNGFPGVVLGLSGGVDSALCAAMAVDALGAEARARVMLPYRYTSNESLSDAAACAKALGVRYDIVPIAEPVEGVERALGEDVRRPAARHHRGEHPEPRARPDPDGDLQQVRRDGGDDRQQVGNVGRLRHALRRHERRLQSDQGPLQDGGLPPVRLRNRWKPAGALGPDGEVIPENIITKPPTRGTAREPEGPGFAAALSGARRHPARPGREGDARSPTSSPRATTRRRCAGSSGCSISPNTSAASRRRA